MDREEDRSEVLHRTHRWLESSALRCGEFSFVGRSFLFLTDWTHWQLEQQGTAGQMFPCKFSALPLCITIHCHSLTTGRLILSLLWPTAVSRNISFFFSFSSFPFFSISMLFLFDERQQSVACLLPFNYCVFNLKIALPELVYIFRAKLTTWQHIKEQEVTFAAVQCSVFDLICFT